MDTIKRIERKIKLIENLGYTMTQPDIDREVRNSMEADYGKNWERDADAIACLLAAADAGDIVSNNNAFAPMTVQITIQKKWKDAVINHEHEKNLRRYQNGGKPYYKWQKG